MIQEQIEVFRVKLKPASYGEQALHLIEASLRLLSKSDQKLVHKELAVRHHIRVTSATIILWLGC